MQQCCRSLLRRCVAERMDCSLSALKQHGRSDCIQKSTVQCCAHQHQRSFQSALLGKVVPFKLLPPPVSLFGSRSRLNTGEAHRHLSRGLSYHGCAWLPRLVTICTSAPGRLRPVHCLRRAGAVCVRCCSCLEVDRPETSKVRLARDTSAASSFQTVLAHLPSQVCDQVRVFTEAYVTKLRMTSLLL